MEELSTPDIIFRKRKKIPSSLADQFDSTLTRSEAKMCIYRSGSGRSRPEVISEEPSPGTNFSVLDCGNARGGSSIKDLRARRVFTPDVNSILQEQNEDKLEEGNDSLKGLDSESVHGRVLDMGSGYMKVDETLSCDEVMTSEVKPANTDNGIPTKKNEAISEEGSLLRSKMALTLCSKRKVFKTPGSFSYRRLLPYLMDIAIDDSRGSKIEIVDAVNQCMSRETCSVKPNSKSCIQNCHNGCVEPQKCHPEHTKLSENKAMPSFQSGLPCNDHDLCDRKDKMDDPSENIGLHKIEQSNQQDVTSQVDVSLEEKSIQMTPPDPDIFTQTEIGVNKEYVETSTFLTENQIRTNNYVCLNQSSDGKQLSDSINSLVLNPSSRHRVFKHPRSLSYRRLLPFLMEISKDNSIKQQKPVVGLIEKPPPLSAATSLEQNNAKKWQTESSYRSQHTEGLAEILLPAFIPPAGSYWNTGANPSSSTPASPLPIDLSNFKPSLEVSEYGASPCVNLDLQTGGILQSQSSPRRLESECSHTDTSGLERNDQSTLQIEESEQVAKQAKSSDLGLEVYNDEAMTSEVKPANTDNGIPLKKNDAISEDGFVLRSKMALTLCSKRKVFKTPGSFSYRRLLPYLMDTVNDDSRVTKIEIVDAVNQCTSRESCSVKSNSKSYIQNCHNGCVERQKCHPEYTQLSENKAMLSFQSGPPCNDVDLFDRKDKRDDPAENIGLHKMEKRNHQDGTSQVDVSLEEKPIQMTPPDPDIFTQTEIGVDKEYVETSTFLTENQIHTNNYVCLDQSSDRKQLSDSINSHVLNPSSRRRVFKHSRSLSYRRLHPFLMEISNNNSCNFHPKCSSNVKQQKPIVDFIEKSHPLSAAAAAASLEQNNAMKLRTKSSYGSQQTERLVEILLPASIPPAGSYWNTGANPSSSTPTSPFLVDLSNVKPSLEVSENGASPCGNLDLQTRGILQSQNSPRGLESECSHTCTSGLERNEQSIVQIEESEQVAKQTKCYDLGLEVYNDNRESIENVQLNQGMLKMDVCNTLFSTIAGPPKGILKKNPRGCRGPCNCLNCSSFHLHAERAFEFSKNQMHDAEEVALELMKEVAKLRHLLKKSITNENGSEIVPLNPIQVEQACSESLETEKVAKVRLSQLNCDLNIHCRTPALLQPKVTFSNYIRERSFPTSDRLVSLGKTE